MARFISLQTLPHWVTGLAWLLLGFCLTAWLMLAQGGAVAAAVQPAMTAPSNEPNTGGVALALGAVAPSTDKATEKDAGLDAARFSLVGVIAKGNGKGAALIVADGKPAKPVAIGGSVVEGVVLTRVERQSVWIAPAQSAKAALELKLVEGKKPSTGTGSASAPISVPTVQPAQPSLPFAVPVPAPGGPATPLDKRKDSATLESDPGRQPALKPALGAALSESTRSAAERVVTSP